MQKQFPFGRMDDPKGYWFSRPAAIGDHIDDATVCWVGGWDRCKVFFVVIVVKECRGGTG